MNKKNIFVARQPVFNKKLETVGYELFFRDGLTNCFPEEINPEYATSKVMSNALHILGVDKLVGNKKAFINFTQKLITGNSMSVFPKDSLVVEILENITPAEEVLDACRSLKEKGYTLALDDFVFEDKYRPLIDLCDIIKVDFLNTTEREKRLIFFQTRNKNIQFLAEKVETYEDFKNALEMGFTLFQGYFFSKPQIIKGKDISSNKLLFLKILREVNQPEFNFSVVENLVKQDVSLTYKLLRFINSANFNFKSNIKNIKHALTILGEIELKKWVTLVTITSIGNDKPEALVVNSITRSLLFEKLAEISSYRNRKSDIFLLGLFSLIDALLDRPKQEILSELPISKDIKTALIKNSGDLYPILSIYENFEKRNWAAFSSELRDVQINEERIPEIYQQVLAEVSSFFQN